MGTSRLVDGVLLGGAIALLALVPLLQVGGAATDGVSTGSHPGRILVRLPVFGAQPIEGQEQGLTDRSGWAIPHLCMSRRLFDVECPGCGLTRATVHTLQGQWRAGFHQHHWGWLAAVLIVMQIPYRILKLAGNHWVNSRSVQIFLSQAVSWGLPLMTLVLLMDWILRMALRPS
jgi:hypothetical protein